jgi:hypothetical protein
MGGAFEIRAIRLAWGRQFQRRKRKKKCTQRYSTFAV